MIIREATFEDNEKLIEIEKKSAQEGKIWLTSFRKDFFHKLNYFDERFMLVAEDENNGEIIGCVGAGFGDYWIEDKKQRGAFVLGLRTNPKYRMKVARWLKEVIKEMEKILKSSTADFAFGTVKSDNINSIKILKHMKLQKTRTLNFYVLPVTRPLGPKEIELEYKPTKDILNNYLEKRKKDFDLVPLDLDRCFFEKLRDKKRLIALKYKSAQALVWDTSGEYDIGITALPPGLMFLRNTLDYVSKIAPLVRVPKLHKPIKTCFVIQFDYKEERDGWNMVRGIKRLAWQKGIDLINFAEDSELKKTRKVLGTLVFTIPFDVYMRDRADSKKELKPVHWPPRI
ncbi:MAG: GNAT family N-acetyltransferase [Kosmotogaceae bacterium]